MARVLQIVTEMALGGATLTMLDFVEDLAAEHEVHIAYGAAPGPDGPARDWHDGPADDRRDGLADNPALRRARERFPTYAIPSLARPLAPRADAAAAHAINQLCRRLQPEIVHTHSSKAGILGRLVAPGAAAPPRATATSAAPPRAARATLHTVHGWGHTPLDSPLRRALLVGAERLVAPRATRLIAVSPEVRDAGLRLHIGRADQYTVIGAPVDMRPHASDFAVARATARDALRLPVDAEVIGWVGRLSAQKDPETLARALAEILVTRHNAYAVLVGDGPDRERVQTLLASEIAARRVIFTGEREDVRSLYPAFDVLLHTTLWEGDPRVVREALAERVPVISARVAGVAMLAGDANLGAVVAPGDARAFVQATAAILDSVARRPPIPSAALHPLRVAADEPYRLMHELYRTVLEESGHDRAKPGHRPAPSAGRWPDFQELPAIA